MKQLVTLLIVFFCFSLKAQDKKEPLIIGEIQKIQSDILKEERVLNIYLPQNYDKEKQYPVIYLLDGTIDEDFIHITGLVQFFNLMFSMPECIVVGIANVDRKRDFTFYTELKQLQEKYPTTGHSEAFINFIEKELKPFIKSTYKTNGTDFIIGQSLGGLLATEILLKKPYLFTHYLIISPSLWWDNESLLNKAEALLKNQKNMPEYVYVAAGKEEDKIMRDEAEKIASVLRKTKKQLKVDFYLIQDENHATILHNSIYKAFAILYPSKW